MTEGGTPPLRIGNRERAAAMAALDEHLAEGRLGVDEYGERSAIAANASTVDELHALFTDLPEPHPQLPGPPARVLPAARGDTAPAPRSGGFLDQWGPRLVLLAPMIALVLFLLTRQWVFFLLVPVAGAVLWNRRR
jgi:hypothetical protein